MIVFDWSVFVCLFKFWPGSPAPQSRIAVSDWPLGVHSGGNPNLFPPQIYLVALLKRFSWCSPCPSRCHSSADWLHGRGIYYDYFSRPNNSKVRIFCHNFKFQRYDDFSTPPPSGRKFEKIYTPSSWCRHCINLPLNFSDFLRVLLVHNFLSRKSFM